MHQKYALVSLLGIKKYNLSKFSELGDWINLKQN